MLIFAVDSEASLDFLCRTETESPDLCLVGSPLASATWLALRFLSLSVLNSLPDINLRLGFRLSARLIAGRAMSLFDLLSFRLGFGSPDVSESRSDTMAESCCLFNSSARCLDPVPLYEESFLAPSIEPLSVGGLVLRTFLESCGEEDGSEDCLFESARFGRTLRGELLLLLRPPFGL